MAVTDKRLYRIETEDFKLDEDNHKYCPWWARRLDAFNPDDTYMLSRYYSDTSVDKWDL
jgi:hypothetical protein